MSKETDIKPPSDKAVACIRLVRRLKATILLPAEHGPRTALLALRCGFIDGPCRILGYDNWITRKLWYYFMHWQPAERKRMLEFLAELQKSANEKMSHCAPEAARGSNEKGSK